MSWDTACDSVCPIARSLSIVGDRWTLLILRELSMGVHRFDELQGQTGMSSHLLTTRLKRLVKDGVIERRLYNERPPRYEYHTTVKGQELDPLLMVLRSWGHKWEIGEHNPPAVKIVHKKTKKVLDHLWQSPNGGKNFTFKDTAGELSSSFAKEREEKLSTFQGD
jgi:DNA-binding HxlR family transcriptional regulator